MNDRTRREIANQRTVLSEVVPLSTPYVLFIDPCGACNFKCNFCPCNNSDFLEKERHAMMDMELFHKILNDIEDFPEKLKVINLYGFGEPLLNKNIFRMIKEIKERELCREVRCTTNGYLLSEEVNRKLVESGIDLIRISVEALTDKDYKEICDVDIDFDKFVDNIRNLYEISRGTNTKVSVKIINAALSDESDANRFYDIFEPISDYAFIQNTTQSWAEFEACIPEDRYDAQNVGNADNKNKICSFALTHMTIHSNGSVGICCQDWKFGTEYGNVKENTLNELWNSKRLRSLRIAHLSGNRNKIPYCKDCEVCYSDEEVEKEAEKIIKKLKDMTVGE